jgi:hypothetical protein
MDTTITTLGTESEWFPDIPIDCVRSLALNTHMGVERALSKRRLQDPEGAKLVVLNYKTTAGAADAILKHKFQITGYAKTYTKRLRIDLALTSGDMAGVHSGAPKKLIYTASAHPLSDLNPDKCGQGIPPRDKQTWAVNMLKQLEKLRKC